MRIEARARARLHFGFLDLSGGQERRFGGMGLSISRPRCVLRIERAPDLIVTGEQAERVELLALRLHEVLEIQPRARIEVVEAIPPHVGLGSGTQMGLALASGIARLHGFDLPVARLCALMGRARRSGVGYHLFQRGGFVVEGGHAVGGRVAAVEPPPLLAQHKFPKEWRVILAIPSSSRTISGEAEEEAFNRLRPAGDVTVDRIARLVLTRLLPAVVERDLAAFGAALTEVQKMIGSCFAAVQRGDFHPSGAALVRNLEKAGACGVGQSSWGPAVYAFAADDAERKRLQKIIRDVDPVADVIATRGWNQGAAIDCA